MDDSVKRPTKTIFCVFSQDDGVVFSMGQLRSLTAVGGMVERNGAQFLKVQDERTLAETLNFLAETDRKERIWDYQQQKWG